MSSSTRIYYCTKEDEGKMRAAALLLKNVAPHFKQVYPEAGWSDNGNQRETPNYPIFWYEHPPVRFMKWDNKGQYYDSLSSVFISNYLSSWTFKSNTTIHLLHF